MYQYESTIQYEASARPCPYYEDDPETIKRRQRSPEELIRPCSNPYYDSNTKELRAAITRINHWFHQVTAETGLVFMPIEIFPSGYRYANPPHGGPYEIVTNSPIPDLPHCNYPYAFFSYEHRDDRRHNEFLLEQMIPALRHYYTERSKYIDDCKRVYANYPRVQEHCYVHLGFQSISAVVSLQELAKYQILVPKRYGYDLKANKYVLFDLSWSSRTEIEFDNLLNQLDWKIEEYERFGGDFRQITSFYTQLRCLTSWEKQHLIPKGS